MALEKLEVRALNQEVLLRDEALRKGGTWPRPCISVRSGQEGSSHLGMARDDC